MTSISWTWKDFWNWYKSLDEEERFHAVYSLIEDGWMENLASEVQIEVIRYAPEEILNDLPLMPQVLKPETIEWSRKNYDK